MGVLSVALQLKRNENTDLWMIKSWEFGWMHYENDSIEGP